MPQILLFWKHSSIHENRCKLYKENDEAPIEVSLIVSMKVSNHVLMINSLDHKQLHDINFIDVDAIIIGIHEFNQDIFNKQKIKAFNCLSIINANHIIHLEFNNESQRNCWFKYIHQNITETGKHWMSHHSQKHVDSIISAAIQYSLQQNEEKKDDDKAKIRNLDDIILTPHRLKTVGILLSGAYFKTPKMLSVRDIFNVFGSNSIKNEYQDEIFVTFAKQNAKTAKYTHLLWRKRRNLINDTSSKSVYIGHLVSIAVNAVNNEQSNDEFDANIFFMKIIWKQHTQMEPLILHHCDLNFLWNFAKALIYCCDAKGVTMEQYTNAIKQAIHKQKQKNKINIFCATYNVATSSPQQSLAAWLKPNKSEHIIPDLYAITLQEIVDLGKNLLTDQHHEYLWEKAIYKVLSTKYVKIESIVRGGLVLYLFAKKEIISEIINISYGALNVGLFGPNKAGVGIRMRIRNQNICFIGAHLPSGIEHCTLRNDAFFRIYRYLKFEGNTKMRNIEVQDHDIIFFFGDLNYRLNIDKAQIGAVYHLIEKREIQKLLDFDQLITSKQRSKIFDGFLEANITFVPTYKYEPNTNKFEKRKKKPLRIPGFTDRILYEIRSNDINMINLGYDAVHSLSLSDHKPVYGVFEINILNDENNNDEYSLTVKQYIEKMTFLQKNYKHHLVQGITQLRLKQNNDKKYADDIIDNIEKSQNELVSNMDALLKYLRIHHDTQTND